MRGDLGMSKSSRQFAFILTMMGLLTYGQASAMHIMEGFLPLSHSVSLLI